MSIWGQKSPDRTEQQRPEGHAWLVFPSRTGPQENQGYPPPTPPHPGQLQGTGPRANKLGQGLWLPESAPLRALHPRPSLPTPSACLSPAPLTPTPTISCPPADSPQPCAAGQPALQRRAESGHPQRLGEQNGGEDLPHFLRCGAPPLACV